jgi:putative ABC transport system permease protein
MWQQRFNRDPSVLGQALTLDGAPYVIIGVLPEAATAFPLNQLQIWVPRPAEVPFLVPSQLNGGGFFFQAIARLRPGVSLTQAREAMSVVAANYRAAYPANVDAPSQIEVVPLLDDAVGQQRQSYLLVAEVSLSLVLLIAVGLLLTSFARLQQVKPGFEPGGVFTAQLALPPTRYDRQRLVAFYEQLYQRLSTLPGSTSAALINRVPLTGGQTPAPVAIGGRPLPPLSERPQANRHLVSPRYFATLRIPILAGRDFDERDSFRVPHVVIVNDTFARRHFPGENPIGRTLVTGMAQLPSQIVGVVGDVRSTSLSAPPEADYFLPALQRPEAFTNILVRTNVSPAAMLPLVREALRSVDPDLPLLQPQPLAARVARTVADRKLALMLLG